MFGGTKTSIDTTKIRNINDVKKIVKFYVKKKMWDEASHLLKETKIHEKNNANRQIENLDEKIETLEKWISSKKYDLQKEKVLKLLNKNIDLLHELEEFYIQEQSKHKFIPEAIERYEDAVKSIKTLLLLSDWDKAKEVLTEIQETEKNAFDKLIAKLDTEWDTIFSESEKKKQRKIYQKKEIQVSKLLFDVETKERNHNNKITAAKFKIRFKKIKSEINLLTKTWRSPQALNVLQSFLEDNKENSSVIKFYNKERSKILKGLEIIKKKEENKIKQNLQEEAFKLAGTTLKSEESVTEKKEESQSLVKKLKDKINFYTKLKERIKKKRLVDEVTLLIEENDATNKNIAESKMATIHKWLTKEIYTDQMFGFDLYWKILWADKISGDTFWFNDLKDKYSLFLWDATGHGIKAGLIVTLMTRIFNKFVAKKSLTELAFEINNWLKQDLQSRNFITWILFQVNKDNTDVVNYVWFGHEPMLIYRKATKEVEKVIPWGLAAWIRMIKKVEDIKEKQMTLSDGDMVLSFSDWVIEAKWMKWEFYWMDRLTKSFLIHAQLEKDSTTVYHKIINDLIAFRGWSAFVDDTTIMILRRDTDNDIQSRDSKYIATLNEKQPLNKKDHSRLYWKSKNQIKVELAKIKKEKELQLIVANLKKHYQIWEFLTLKQEAVRHIKNWWVHKDINMYLRKALDNETKYRVNLKNQKVENKFNVLEQLYKAWDYETVIQEAEYIISKEWDI